MCVCVLARRLQNPDGCNALLEIRGVCQPDSAFLRSRRASLPALSCPVRHILIWTPEAALVSPLPTHIPTGPSWTIYTILGTPKWALLLVSVHTLGVHAFGSPLRATLHGLWATFP